MTPPIDPYLNSRIDRLREDLNQRIGHLELTIADLRHALPPTSAPNIVTSDFSRRLTSLETNLAHLTTLVSRLSS